VHASSPVVTILHPSRHTRRPVEEVALWPIDERLGVVWWRDGEVLIPPFVREAVEA
jgi:hypothetical protein